MNESALTPREQAAQPPNWLSLLLAFFSGLLLEIVLDLARSMAKLSSRPFVSIWEDIQTGLFHWIWRDAGAGLVLFAFIGFLICVVLALRYGTEHFEEVLSKKERQIIFIVALLVGAIFISPYLNLDQKDEVEVNGTNSHR